MTGKKMIKLLLSFLTASLVLNILLFSLYKASVTEKSSVEQSLQLCSSALESSNKRAEASEARCKVLDGVVREYQEESKLQSNSLFNELEQLEIIQVFEKQAERREELNEQKNVVSPSGRLPDALTRLLRESYDRTKGNVYLHP